MSKTKCAVDHGSIGCKTNKVSPKTGEEEKKGLNKVNASQEANTANIKGDAVADTEAEFRNQMIENNLALVNYVLKSNFGHYAFRGIDREDLYQAGSEALTRAAKRFDFNRGIEFSTYAVRSITHGILREVQSSAYPNRVSADIWNKLSEFRRLKSLGRSFEEIRTELGVRKDMAQALDSLSAFPLELDADIETEDGESACYYDVIPDSASMNAFREVDRKDYLDKAYAEAKKLLNALSPEDQDVFCKRNGIGCEKHTLESLTDSRRKTPGGVQKHISRLQRDLRNQMKEQGYNDLPLAE